MFKYLRSQAKIFYWVIAATFILFLFLGGMTGRGCQPPGADNYEAGVLGSVNGTKIMGQEYDYAYRQTLAQMRQGSSTRDLNANQYASARQMAWDYMVRDILLDQAIQEFGITVTDEEVLDTFQNNPPPELLNSYVDENGQVDLNRYFADLQNPENDWSRAEAYIRTLLPRQKLETMIAQDAFVSDEDVRSEYIRQSGRAVAEYIGILYSDLDSQEPSGDDIQAWFDSHTDDYQSPSKIKCKAVRFEKSPSDADYQEVLQFMQTEIRPRIVNQELTFEQAAIEYSEDSSATTGGDLGTFDRNRMAAPFTEAAFDLKIGEISEPVRTKFGWHLIEILEQEIDMETGEVFQVHARHILLKVAPGIDTLDQLRDSAQDFRARVDGGSFASTAEAEAHDLLDPVPFIEGRDIPGLAFTLAGSQWLSHAGLGEVSQIFDTDDFLYLLLAEEAIPAGTRPLDEVKGQIRLAVQKENNRKVARALLAPAVGEIQMGSSIEEFANNESFIYMVTDTFNVNDNITNVGYGTEFNKAAIEGTVDLLIPEVETLRGLFALKPLWIKPFDSMDFVDRKDGIRAALVNRQRAEILEQWFQERRDNAEIIDQRHALSQGI
ncbi:MAG: SurA N-terminal domain-containing protein [Gemmatimonadales bacterium]|nr:SurA N-terminal domain-containing protein [Gemmatimonadales bacterium]